MSSTVVAGPTHAVADAVTDLIPVTAGDPTPRPGRRDLKRALAILHDAYSSPGYVGEVLGERGWSITPWIVVPAELHERPGSAAAAFPDATGYELVIVLGAPWSTQDARISPWLECELDWLAAIVKRGGAVLGICFGAQLLALSQGATVSQAPHPEIGWFAVDSERLPPGPWFQWHVDRFTLPRRATALAVNAVGTQAFQQGRCLGVQWHPEVTPTGIYTWICHGGAHQLREQGLQPAMVMVQAHRYAASARARAAALVDYYLAEVFAATPEPVR